MLPKIEQTQRGKYNVEKPVLFLSAKNFIRLMKIIRAKMTRKAGDNNIILSNRYGKCVNAKIKELATEARLTYWHQLIPRHEENLC